MDCDNYNQYFSEKCFKGEEVYPKMKGFGINDYSVYKSKDYYSFINENMEEYSFNKDYPELTFKDICESGDYSLKQQQKFAGRIFNTHVENRGILIYHGLGSGKTQTSIVIGEAFKSKAVDGKPIVTKPVKGEPYNARSPQHVLIVVPASLVKQYYSEIIGFIDAGKIKSAAGEILINGNRQYYIDEKLRRGISILEKNIMKYTALARDLPEDTTKYSEYQNKLIQFSRDLEQLQQDELKKVNKVYEIMSHERFLNKLYTNVDSAFEKGNYLERLQSPNSLLIIDEAHKLVSASGTSYRKLLFALRFHAHPDFRTVLLSGTPIYDKPFEFGLLLNLLRPRILFPDGYDNFNAVFFDTETKLMKNKELFKKMISGYVSYFKGGNPEAYPYKKTTVIHHSMNQYQYERYLGSLIEEVKKDKENGSPDREEFLIKFISSESNTDEVTTSVFNNSRLYCNIAFPEVTDVSNTRKSIGELGLVQFRTDLRSEIRSNPRLSKEEIKKNVLRVVENYSSKFAGVYKLIEKSEGPVFIYSNYVTYGVEPMAVVLSALGYTSFTGQDGENKYFIWKGGLNPDDVNQAKDVFNSIENKDGSLIKVMFGTQSVMEGVDFKRVRQIHILDPWWNDSRMQQVIARGIRLCSHAGVPPEQRNVDVFIHLSTVPSGGESVYRVVYTNEEGNEIKTFSSLKPANPRETIDKWFYHPSILKINKQNQLDSITESKSVFFAYQIKTFHKLKDPELSRIIGTWKNLDSDSVEQYMYSRALNKVFINRQFENVIKETSIDCKINKYGNIIRLEERYEPEPSIRDVYKLYYENYSSGEKYIRKGVRSAFNSTLPDGILTLEDILSNTAKKTKSLEFVNIDTGAELTVKSSSLVIMENNDCAAGDIEYSFDSIPESIVNLTINKEMIPFFMKIKLNDLKKILFDIEHGTIKVDDPKLISKIKKFYKKDALTEKQQIIEKLIALGIGDQDTPWELETPQALKKLYKDITGKKVN
jgi:superfamily II DNA or RNA helicase